MQIICDGGDAGLANVIAVEPLCAMRIEVERSSYGVGIVDVGRGRRCRIAVAVAEEHLIGKAERLAIGARAAEHRLVVIVADGVMVGEEFEKRRITILHVEKRHGLPGIMRRAARRRAVSRRNCRLQIVQAARRVALRHVFCVDRAIHLLIHLEVLMDRVAGEGVERHGRSGQLERPRRQRGDVGDPRIGTNREGQAGASGSEKELILRRQARIPARKAQDANVGRDCRNAGHIGRRQRGVELLLCQIGVAKEFAAVRRGNDLILMRLGELRARRAMGIDDAFRQQVQYPLVSTYRHVSGEKMIEAAIFANDDDDVLDRRGSPGRASVLIGFIGVVLGSGR